MRIRHVRADEADRVRAIRLEALRSDPSAFGATYERDLARSSRWWERWARLSEAGEEQRTFVAVDDDDVGLGIALVRADDDAPGDAVLRPAGKAWFVYVRSERDEYVLTRRL